MFLRRLSILIALTLGLAACGDSSDGQNPSAADGQERLEVVATFSIIGDIVSQVGGEKVDVHSIVPLGVDPHEYSPLPLDLKKSTDSDIIFWNGLNMEIGGAWFESLVDVAGKEMDSDQVVEVTTKVERKYLHSATGEERAVNPHAFLDPNVGMLYAESVRDALIQIDPENSQVYEDNATAYLSELVEIDELYRTKIAEIPPAQRVLVTSEHAYQYMTERYGLTSGYIWEIDTDEQGTPEQIASLVKLIKDSQVPVVFVESNVDARPMETIAKEAGVPVFGKLFSDELGHPGKDGGTYLEMLKFNIAQIHAGLAQ